MNIDINRVYDDITIMHGRTYERRKTGVHAHTHAWHMHKHIEI